MQNDDIKPRFGHVYGFKTENQNPCDGVEKADRLVYNMGMLKLVLVDIDNTLLDFDKCSEDSMKRACEDFGIPFERSMFEVFKRTNDRLWLQIEQRTLTKERLFEIRWNLIFHELGVRGVDGVEFEKQFHVYLNVSHIPVDGALSALEYLASRYRVCAASNAVTSQQPLRLEKAGMLKYIERLFLSDKMGSPKPQREFFDICLAQLGDVRPDEMLMLGDSLSADISGAAAYGIRTCWYNHNHIPYDTSSPPADFVIEHMQNVRDIL